MTSQRKVNILSGNKRLFDSKLKNQNKISLDTVYLDVVLEHL
jgi:hypothetical protein